MNFAWKYLYHRPSSIFWRRAVWYEYVIRPGSLFLRNWIWGTVWTLIDPDSGDLAGLLAESGASSREPLRLGRAGRQGQIRPSGRRSSPPKYVESAESESEKLIGTQSFCWSRKRDPGLVCADRRGRTGRGPGDHSGEKPCSGGKAYLVAFFLHRRLPVAPEAEFFAALQVLILHRCCRDHPDVRHHADPQHPWRRSGEYALTASAWVGVGRLPGTGLWNHVPAWNWQPRHG